MLEVIGTSSSDEARERVDVDEPGAPRGPADAGERA